MTGRRTSGRRLLATLAVAGLLVAACGDGESEEEAVISALAASLQAEEELAEYDITDEEATCVATETVDALGVDRTVEIGFVTEGEEPEDLDFGELDEGEITVLGDAMEGCLADARQLVVDALAGGILEEQDPAFPVEEAEATCVAEAVADEVSLSRLIVIGVETEGSDDGTLGDLSPEESGVFADAFVGCIDVRTILLDSIAASGGVPDEVLTCLDVNITDEDIEALFLAGFTGQDGDAAAAEVLTPAIEACVGEL